MNDNKNVLFICRVFPPEGGSAVQRPAKFVKFINRYGWYPYVVTCHNGGALRDESLLDDIHRNVPVMRSISAEPEFLKMSINKKWQKHKWVSAFFMIILKIYSVIYYRIAIPDDSIGWIPFALLKSISFLKGNRIDLVYVHNQPPSSFIIGFLLKKLYGLPLVLDYDDPWTTDSRYSEGSMIKRYLSRIMERRFLHSADLIIYCKVKVHDGIRTTFGQIETRKMVFISNGYDPKDFNLPAIKKPPNRFRLIYTGKLTRKFCYSPESFFTALSDMIHEGLVSAGDIEVIVAGIVANKYLNMIKAKGLQDIVRCVGYVSHKQSISYLKSADGLLLLIESEKGKKASASFSGSMPAKIFEYLYAAKPILAIIPDGPEMDLIKHAGYGIFAEPNDPKSAKKAILELLRILKSNGLENHTNWKITRAFDRRKLTEKLAQALSLCLEKSHVSNSKNRFSR